MAGHIEAAIIFHLPFVIYAAHYLLDNIESLLDDSTRQHISRRIELLDVTACFA